MAKNVLFILMPEKYRAEEFYEPYNMLVEQGYTVDVAGLREGIAEGANGYKYTPEIDLNKLDFKDLEKYDALVIPGGPGSSTYLWKDRKVLETITYFYQEKKIIAAICYAVIALVEAGILEGKKATVSDTTEAKNIFKENNVTFSSDGCSTLEDEKIITAQGPAFAKEFGIAIANMLEEIN